MNDVVRMAETQSKCSHTPGPWKAEAVVGDDMHDICGHSSPGQGCPNLLASVAYDEDDPLPHLSLSEANANARLIAAAPDLLALCKEMKQWLVPEVTKEPDRTYFWKLVDVIRKAEGRDPLSGRPEVEYPNEASMIRDNGDAP